MSAKVLPFDEARARRRIANKTGEERCERCGDEGMLIVGTEMRRDAAYDVAGPCPFCEQGYAVEFGLGRDKEGNTIQAKRPPWGAEGFWRGREREHV